MLEFGIRGAGELRAAARQLGIEQKALRRGAIRALERGVRGLRTAIPAAAKRLPSGYGQVMAADVKVSTSIKLASRDPAITVKVWAPGGPAAGNRDVETIDAGILRHPFFGNRERWYGQTVRPGFASEPFTAARPTILAEIEKDWDDMVSRVERG